MSSISNKLPMESVSFLTEISENKKNQFIIEDCDKDIQRIERMIKIQKIIQSISSIIEKNPKRKMEEATLSNLIINHHTTEIARKFAKRGKAQEEASGSCFHKMD
jgi:hypothetical protein